MDNQNAVVQIFDGSGLSLRLETWDLPSLGAGELLIKMDLATICGSDLHTVAGIREEATPCILGHERGVSHVFCVDVQEQRLAQVSQFGGIPVNGRSPHYPQSREQITAVAPHGVDAVLEFAGVAGLVPEGIRLLRPGGYYGFVGMVHPHSQLELTGEQIIRKSLTIFGIHNYAPIHLEQAVEFLAQTVHKYPYESLVSPPLALAHLEERFQLAQTQQWYRVSIQPD